MNRWLHRSAAQRPGERIGARITMSYGITETIGTESARADSLHSVVVPSEKSKTFFAKLLARRQTPGNCVRCGHKNPQPKHKTCPRCLDAVRRRKKNNQPPQEIAGMLRRIASLEYAVANLQLTANNRYQKGYAAGKKSALKPHRKYFDAYQRISKQELATMNHAYDRA